MVHVVVVNFLLESLNSWKSESPVNVIWKMYIHMCILHTAATKSVYLIRSSYIPVFFRFRLNSGFGRIQIIMADLPVLSGDVCRRLNHSTTSQWIVSKDQIAGSENGIHPHQPSSAFQNTSVYKYRVGKYVCSVYMSSLIWIISLRPEK